MKKFINKEKRATNVDEMIGRRGVMLKGCDEYHPGEIKINGVVWTAINLVDNEEIKENEKVVIVGIDGNKLIVKKEGK